MGKMQKFSCKSDSTYSNHCAEDV